MFSRVEKFFGPDGMQRLQHLRVILFGVGGVGSWCAESLVRSGIINLTIVDPDVINPSNINRQLMATTQSLGQPKVKALKERLLAINPLANIIALQEAYTKEKAAQFQLSTYDFIIDAIDSVPDKISLILEATALEHPRFFSSMGAALKIDPEKICVAEFHKITGCPLARMLRKRMKQLNLSAQKKFRCVYSQELPKEREAQKKALPSLVHITAIFGFTLSGLVLKEIYQTP